MPNLIPLTDSLNLIIKNYQKQKLINFIYLSPKSSNSHRLYYHTFSFQCTKLFNQQINIADTGIHIGLINLL